MPASPSGADLRLGTTLRGKYRLDRVIGTGGMAVVYKATHRNHAEFAVKMLLPELSVVEDIRSRFLREGYAANAVKHPGAVLVVDDDVADDGAAFLVMELLDGVPCDQLWGSVGKKIPVKLASAIVLQLLDVLAAAHDKGIVHRDVKPANLFLTRAGVVKVLDFGIARAREAVAGAHAHATGSGMALGTPAFMAPEHARGRAREIDGRTDLWAAAATFFAMVSGELVHDAETPNEFLIEAATKPARSLRTTAPDVPAPIIDVMDRALAFERTSRWATAGAMRDALRAAHEQAFDAEPLESIVASAVRTHVPPPAPAPPHVSPAAVTRTALPDSGPHPTERLSTPSAIARDRQSMRPGSPRWIAVASLAALGALLLATMWLKGRSAPRAAGDAGESDTTATSSAPVSAASEIARDATGPAPADARAPQTSDEPAPAPPEAHGASAPAAHSPSRLPPRPARPSPSAAPPLAASCNPPWFFDSDGHKQYKPECL